MPNNWEKLIVALDLEDESKIQEVVQVLGPKGVKFKIGSIAFTKFGPQFLKEFITAGYDIFLDLKLYDIPNTMAKTARVIGGLDCWAFTVHLQAGQQALEAVKEAVEETARESGNRKPLILGVSVLTSSKVTQHQVNNLVELAQRVGIDGVISSAQDAEGIKKMFPKMQVVTPGIRSREDEIGDQVRVATAKEAFSNGSDYIVVGRPIINKKDYLKAVQAVLEA